MITLDASVLILVIVAAALGGATRRWSTSPAASSVPEWPNAELFGDVSGKTSAQRL